MYAAPVTLPPALAIVTPSSRTPLPSNRSDAVAFWNGSPYATPFVDRHAAEADRVLVLARPDGTRRSAAPDTG